MLLNFVEYLSHFHTPFRWFGPFVSYRTAGARFGSSNRGQKGDSKIRMISIKFRVGVIVGSSGGESDMQFVARY